MKKSGSTGIVAKEKFVASYEELYEKHSAGEKSVEYYEQLFLLKVKQPWLTTFVQTQIAAKDKLAAQKTTQIIVAHAIAAMNNRHVHRITNSIQTLHVFFDTILSKYVADGNYGFEAFNWFSPMDELQDLFADIIHSVRSLLKGGVQPSLKAAALDVLLVLATATDNVNQNFAMEYFMKISDSDLFGVLCESLEEEDADTYKCMGMQVSLLLVILGNYRKFETKNPYVKALTNTTSPKTVFAFGQILDVSWQDAKDIRFPEVSDQQEDPNQGGGGFFSTITSIMSTVNPWQGALSPKDPKPLVSIAIRATLHIVYELAHQANPGFGQFVFKSREQEHCLLQHFFSVSSYLLQSPRKDGPACYHEMRMCLLTFLCVTRDTTCMERLTTAVDANIDLYSKETDSFHKPEGSPTIASVIVDTMARFLQCNLVANIDHDSYSLVLGTLKNIIPNSTPTPPPQAEAGDAAAGTSTNEGTTTSDVDWKKLWGALMRLVRFLTSSPTKNMDTKVKSTLLRQCVDVISCIMYHHEKLGIDVSKRVDIFYELLRHTTSFEFAKSLCDDGTNVLSTVFVAIAHFSKALDPPEAEDAPPLDMAEVAKVIEGALSTLQLPPLNIPHLFDRYFEYNERDFFVSAVRALIVEYKSLRQ
eukprot:GFYU01004834.1.p1 GENE.GFYU01004834.1~~GFYU01004834.1.p1  ORF type:complete len:644 (-),score=168.72 GFYU01004834.1:16-1947(-)